MSLVVVKHDTENKYTVLDTATNKTHGWSSEKTAHCALKILEKMRAGEWPPADSKRRRK